MNEAESRAGAVSVDALLNYETVKYFCNEDHEYDRFDFHMTGMGKTLGNQ